MKVTRKQTEEALATVIDPEIGVSIVDLGLVYKVTVAKQKVHILMTLTTIGCPLFSIIEREIRTAMTGLGFRDEDVTIELTFDPPWSMDRLSERAKAIMGI